MENMKDTKDTRDKKDIIGEYLFLELNRRIENTGLSVRFINNCRALGIKRVFQFLQSMKNRDIRFLQTVGKKSEAEVKRHLLRKGIDIDKLLAHENLESYFSLQKALFRHPIIVN